MSDELKFPMFFDVDDLPVKVYKEGDELVCVTDSGFPYGIGKAFSEGKPITEEEFDKFNRYPVN